MISATLSSGPEDLLISGFFSKKIKTKNYTYAAVPGSTLIIF